MQCNNNLRDNTNVIRIVVGMFMIIYFYLLTDVCLTERTALEDASNYHLHRQPCLVQTVLDVYSGYNYPPATDKEVPFWNNRKTAFGESVLTK